MALIGKQIRQLRSLAHHLDPVVTIGKSGIVQGTIEQTDASLEAHELIKCNVLESSGLTARDAANQLAELTHADIVQVIGRKFTLYRETSRDDVEKIQLVH